MSDVSKEYGGALFDLACEENLDFEILGQLRVVGDILSKNPQYIKFISAPNIPQSERVAAVGEAFDGNVHVYISSFIKMLTERGHGRDILECIKEFERRYYEHKGLVIAKVESASELSDKQKNAILAKLEKRTGKDVELRCSVNPELIGGMRIIVGDVLLEGSVRAKLDELRKNLTDTTL